MRSSTENLHHPYSGVVWKKCKPFIWTVKGEAFKHKTDAIQSCHAVGLWCLNENHGSGARRSAESPQSCKSQDSRNIFQTHFCL